MRIHRWRRAFVGGPIYTWELRLSNRKVRHLHVRKNPSTGMYILSHELWHYPKLPASSRNADFTIIGMKFPPKTFIAQSPTRKGIQQRAAEFMRRTR